MYRTKNHRNILLTRNLPSNAEKEHVFVILYDFLAGGWANFIELAGVLLPAKTREGKVSFPRKARRKTKYMIERHDFRWLGPAATNITSSSLQTSQ